MSLDIDKRLFYSQLNPTSNRESQNINNLRATESPQPRVRTDEQNTSKLASQEILKSSPGSSLFTGQKSGLYGQAISQNMNSNLQGQPNRVEPGTTYTLWADMVKDQAQIARKDLENQKTEDRIRKQRYREYLNKLAQEQKHQKMLEQAEHMNSYPNRDWEAYKEFDNAYKQNQQMHKQQIRDSLDENFRAHMDKKLQLRQEKELTDAQMLKKYEEARKFEHLSKSMERERKNVLMTELKSEAQRYTKHLMEQDFKRQALDREYNQQETSLLLQKERDAKIFYDKIRQQSLERNMKGLENLQPFVKEAHQRNQHLDQLIEQARLDKLRIEAEEQKIRRERQRQMHVVSQIDNEQIMKMKMTEEQIRKQEADLKFEEMRKRLEESKKLEMMKRMAEQDNKRQYQNILNHQVQERMETRKHENNLNRIEQQLMARKDPENAFIAVPNGKYSYERQLQLRYIDNWLLRSPALPSDEHQRLKYKKDPFEPVRGVSGYHGAGGGFGQI